MKNLPKQTSEIFDILSKGQFISALGKTSTSNTLYAIISEGYNEELLREYFAQINFILEKGNGFYYFSRKDEANRDIERRIESLEKFIDILDFFSSLENKPIHIGNVFTPSQLAEETNTNPILSQKLKAIKYISDIDSAIDKIRKIVSDLAEQSFLEKIDKFEEKFLVLDSFHYLETLIASITPTEND